MKTLSQRKPKATKGHVCDFCYDKINKGEVYENSTNVYEGVLYTWKTHHRCSEIASKLKMYDDADEGVTGDMFIDYINDYYSDLNQVQIDDSFFRKTTFKQRLDEVCEKFLK